MFQKIIIIAADEHYLITFLFGSPGPLLCHRRNSIFLLKTKIAGAPTVLTKITSANFVSPSEYKIKSFKDSTPESNIKM